MSSSPGILGIDTSHYSQQVDWAKAKAGGVQWMYSKASQGSEFVDQSLGLHTSGAKAAGILTTAYHFFMANVDGDEQWNVFARTIQGKKFDLPHVLDWEAGSIQGMSPAHQILQAKRWLAASQKYTGKVPWIYMGEDLALSLKLPSEFGAYPLISARYGVKVEQLRIPSPWTKLTAWQYSESAIIPGIKSGHTTDANYFLGSMSDLLAFAKQ